MANRQRFGGSTPARQTQNKAVEAVARLNELSSADPERAHSEADDVLLSLVPAEVRLAYKKLVARSSWWAAG